MEYYHHTRREITPLLPTQINHALEVGAGAGATLKWLKSIHPAAKTTGLEINSELRRELERNADTAIIGDIDECLPQLKSYDLILLLDVLEHLPDPTATLQKLSKLLTPSGRVIVSVPNIAHLSITLPLLFKRRFTYQDAGILDRTHLKFFVEDTAVGLLNDANLMVTAGLLSGFSGPRTRMFNRLSFGLLRHHLTKQYILLGELRDQRVVQEPFRWTVT